MLGFKGVVTVETQGHNGGLDFLWRNNDKVTLSSFSKNHIDIIVEIKGWNKFRSTGFYGEPNPAKRI